MSNEKDTISIIFSDSLAYGLYDKEASGWASRLRKYMDNYCNGNYIINLAIPGQTSNDILKRFETELKNRYNNTDNFILIFSFGIKDSLFLNEDNNYINIFKNNLTQIIFMSKKYTNDILFVGLINPNNEHEKRKNYDLNNVLKIDNCIEKTCKENSINYIKLKDKITKEELSEDGLHPNNRGYAKIGKIILKKIYKIEQD